MIDKGKYASHGAFIKKINEKCLGKRDKKKLAIINPIPTTKPRQRQQNQTNDDMKLQSKKFDAKFKFQDQIKIKPVPADLIQPFLYIEKVLKPTTVDQKHSNTKLKPFVTSKKTNTTRKNTNMRTIEQSAAPQGYRNLFEYEQQRKNIANKMFQKILQAQIDNIKDLFNLWNKNPNRKLGNDINIEEQQFKQFVKEMLPSRISNNHIKHFFDIYKNKNTSKSSYPKQTQEAEKIKIPETISIRAFSYNFNKYRKAQTEINNIMSEKAVKDRFKEIKLYIENYLKQYPSLKQAMKGIKQYEEVLRNHFQRSYESYKNPFQDQIDILNQQLKKPIIKYDKTKKQELQEKLNKYEQENRRLYDKLTDQYDHFMQSYQSAIVKNHDLFFTKRTVVHLIKPIIECYPYITRQLLQQQIEMRRQQKQHYLQSLSDIIVEIDNDKKHIMEDSFTMGDIVQIIEGRKKKGILIEEQQIQFVIDSVKKLIKQLKRQFLLKNKLLIEDLDNFPADQQIPLQILHTCFEMQCTKVLFKNQIWNQFLNIIPQRSITSKFHQHSIDRNTCMEYTLKYFRKLDERSKIQLNKSKQISLLAENAYNHNFGQYAEVINKVCARLDTYVQGIDEDKEIQQLLRQKQKKKKKVGFADIVDSKLAVDRGQQNILQRDRIQQQNQNLAKSIIKMIHHPESQQKIKKSSETYSQQDFECNINTPAENLSMLKTLAKSYFEPQAMNTNAFDIRFYEKINEQQKKSMDPSLKQQRIQLGQSLILKGVPGIEQLQGDKTDPLRISRFLLKNIDEDLKEEQKVIREKYYDHDIKEGVSNNYFREKIKLENKPTRYDSDGKSKYSALLPVGYYQSYIVGENVPEQEKWYLRSHHVQTLTENPLSKKDNVINTQYQSKLEKLGLKKRPDQFVIEANVKRKQQLINALQERIGSLKNEVMKARRSDQIQGTKVSTGVLDDYYTKLTDGKQDKQLQLAGYQSVLFDLRRKQRQLVNQYRDKQTHEVGEPNMKWWQRKDKQFNHELKKDRILLGDRMGKHREYVQKLKNNEIY